MTRDEALKRIAELEEQRAYHEREEARLEMERDQIIYDVLKPKPSIVPAPAIAAVIGTDRSWPYTMRDTFHERLARYRDKYPDPTEAQRKEAERAKRRERDARRRERQAADELTQLGQEVEASAHPTD
jgi:hypothetical protein